MTREVRLTWLVFAVFWVYAVPISAVLDSWLTLNPSTQDVTVVEVTADETGVPGFWDYVWFFVRLNGWEMTIMTAGAIIGILTWNRKVRLPF